MIFNKPLYLNIVHTSCWKLACIEVAMFNSGRTVLDNCYCTSLSAPHSDCWMANWKGWEWTQALWCILNYCDVNWGPSTWSEMLWRDVRYRDVTGGTMAWLEVLWHVLGTITWLEVLWHAVRYCDVIWDPVTWFEAMWRDLRSCDVNWDTMNLGTVTW